MFSTFDWIKTKLTWYLISYASFLAVRKKKKPTEEEEEEEERVWLVKGAIKKGGVLGKVIVGENWTVILPI